jgi:hypothetical protein
MSRAWWHTSVIPALGRQRQEYWRSQPGLYNKTLSQNHPTDQPNKINTKPKKDLHVSKDTTCQGIYKQTIPGAQQAKFQRN